MTDGNQTTWTQIIGWSLGAIGWVVGIAAGLIQFKSYRDQKNLEKGYLTILEQAKRDWKGKYTQAEIQSLAQELGHLQKKIQNEVPKEARKIFLRDQLETMSESIGELYTRHSELSSELGAQSEASPLPLEVQKAIETTILPTYIFKQRRQRLIHLLLGAILALVILVNYTFLIDSLSTKIKIGLGTRYRVGLLLWCGLVLASLIWFFSRFFNRRIGPWFAKKSALPMLALAACWVPSLLLLILLLAISPNWWESYTEWQIWTGRTAGMIIALAPISFSIVATWHMLALSFNGRGSHPPESAYSRAAEETLKY